MASELLVLHNELVNCDRCARLVEYRRQIGQVKRRAYQNCEYWARPVPGFGDPNAHVLILGLAPGAHGSNRTGRPFTGDASGKFMYPILYATGFASQPNAEHREDGLKLRDCYITAALRCAPPANKPAPQELVNCAPFLDREIAALRNLKVVVALGRIAFDAYLEHLRRTGFPVSRKTYVFGHGLHYVMPDGVVLLISYHPSNQNTATGKLTAPMFHKIFETARHLAEDRVRVLKPIVHHALETGSASKRK